MKPYERNDNLAEDQKAALSAIKALHKELHELLDKTLIQSREKSLAMTSIEEGFMWANKCVTHN